MLIQEKIDQAIGILRELHVDCWITFVRESEINADPILDFLAPASVTWHSAFIFTSGGRRIAIVGQYDRHNIEETGAYEVVTAYVTGIKEHLQQVLREVNPSQIAVNFSVDSEICDGITHGMFLTLQAYLKEIGMENRIISAEPIVSALRQRKTQSELQYIREAIRHTEEIFEKVSRFIRPGRTEKEIAGFMKKEVMNRGLEFAWDETGCPAVFTGPETAGAHYHPTDRRVEEGHLLNMDFGVRYKGYCSDLQRTFYILTQNETAVPLEVQRGFDTLTTAIERAKNALKPGVPGVDVDRAAREYIVSQGYEEYPHGLGHQVGRFAHDGTALLGPAWEKYAGKPFVRIESGMVFTIEPRLTVPDRGIVTIENMVLVTDDGAQWLSTPQTELWLIR